MASTEQRKGGGTHLENDAGEREVCSKDSVKHSKMNGLIIGLFVTFGAG